MDLAHRVLRRDGHPDVHLTALEAELLAYLVENPHHTVSRDELLAKVWKASPNVRTRAVDNTVRRLREKIEENPDAPLLLQTVYAEGYRFVPPSSELAHEAANAAALVDAARREPDLRVRLVLLDRALASWEGDTSETVIRAERAETRAALGLLEDARDDVELSAIELERRGMSSVHLAEAVVARWEKRFREAADALAVVLAQPDISPDERAIAHRRLGALASDQGRWEEARASFELALRERVPRLEGMLHADLGTVFAELGEPERGRAHLRVAIEHAREGGDDRRRMIAEANLGMLEHMAGKLDEAEAHLEAARALSTPGGDPRYDAYVAGARGCLLHERGRLMEAYVLADQSVSGFRNVRDPAFEAISLARRAAVAFEIGRERQSARDFASARERLEDTPQAWVSDGVAILEAIASSRSEPPPPRIASSFARIAMRIVRAARRR